MKCDFEDCPFPENPRYNHDHPRYELEWTPSGVKAAERWRIERDIAISLLRRWVTPERDMTCSTQDLIGLHLHDETEAFLLAAQEEGLEP